MDYDPKICASYYCNKHVVKIPIEIAQLLSKIHNELKESNNLDQYYKNPQMISKNIPIYIWIKQSKQNYLWTVELGIALIDEYKFRYDKSDHKTEKVLRLLKNDIPKSIPDIGMTPFLMTNKFDMYQYLSKNILLNCRFFYADVKCKNDKWNKRGKPNWFIEMEDKLLKYKRKYKKRINKQLNILFSKTNIRPFLLLRICYDTLFQGKWQRKAHLMNRYNDTKKLFNQLNFTHLYFIYEIAKKMDSKLYLKKYYLQSMKYRKKYDKLHFPNEQINYKKNYDYYIYTIDLRGIFVIQPYSSNIVPNIDYNNPEKTFDNLLFLFNGYIIDEDFIGADMIRKYTQFMIKQCKAYYNKNKKNIFVNNDMPFINDLFGKDEMLKQSKLYEKLLIIIKENEVYLKWIYYQNYMNTDPYKPDNYIFKNVI